MLRGTFTRDDGVCLAEGSVRRRPSIVYRLVLALSGLFGFSRLFNSSSRSVLTRLHTFGVNFSSTALNNKNFGSSKINRFVEDRRGEKKELDRFADERLLGESDT